MLEFIKERVNVWEVLQTTTKPIVLYGMGNGADKILDWCELHHVKVEGVFASDEFVRGQIFRGFKVERYIDLIDRLGYDILIVIAFASESKNVLAKFRQLSEQHQVVAPHLALFDEKEIVSSAWLKKYSEKLQYVYEHLADSLSKKVFADTLNYKLSGKIEYLFDCESEREKDLREIFSWSEQEIYLDLGAYNGDTLLEMKKITNGSWKQAIAVEPDRRNCRKLRTLAETFAEEGLPVKVYEKGIWEVDTELSFSDSGGRQSTFMGTKKSMVPVTNIDTIADTLAVSYIKMDVEGAEKQALAGGKNIISLNKPKMFIAAYHYDVDIFLLPLLLWKLVPEYKIYLRKHPYVPAWELNFLAVKD